MVSVRRGLELSRDILSVRADVERASVAEPSHDGELEPVPIDRPEALVTTS